MNRKYIASGFRQDMESLLSRFLTPEDETKCEISLRFSRFCQIWREMMFSYVFRMRVNDNDLREFVDEIYLEVLPNVSEEHRLERRVCSLYLLYSLFLKQPKISGKSSGQRIRINFSYLEQIRDLVEKCKQLGQLDVCYVWYKMLSMGAVDLVHVSRLMGPQYIRNSRVTEETQTQTDFLIDQFRTSLIPPIDELSHIHEKYRTLKEALSEENKQIETVNQIEDNIFELSKAKMDSLHKEFANKSLKIAVEPMFDIESQEFNEINERSVDNIGDKRRKLKERSFAFGCKATDQSVPSNEATVGQNCSETKTKTKTQSKGKPKRKKGRPKVSRLTEIM